MTRAPGLVAALAAAAACRTAEVRPAPAAAEPNAEIAPDTFDRSVSACDDFYQHVCGGWIARTELPPGKGSVARYEAIAADNDRVLREIVELSARAPSSPDQRRIGDFYAACMAAEQEDAGAAAALADELARVEAVRDRATLAAAVARLHLLGGGIGPWWLGRGALFGMGTDYALDDGTRAVAQLDQGGLGLPDPAYHADRSAEGVALRARYREHVAAMLRLSGVAEADATAQAQAVVALEDALAAASVPEAARRDPAQAHHPVTRTELARRVPSFDWAAYFAALGRPDLDAINLMVPSYYEEVERTLRATDPAALRPYLRWHLLHALGPALPGALGDEHRRGAALLTGSAERPPRAEECLAEVNTALGWALAAEFVARRFPGEAQAEVDAMADRITAALGARFDAASWLDAPTRRAAHDKLARVGRKIGRPARWRSYDGLAIGRRSHLANRIAATAFEAAFWLRRAGTQPPRDEWLVTPQTLTAYYDVARNEMVFAAAIFQPPLFHRRGRAASNHGGIGWVLGHELSHGFDAGGRRFDASGAARSWWSPSADAAFQERARCVVAQYSSFEALPGLKVDGERTLTENLADLGAARLAYDAYRAARAGQPPAAPVAGFDADQQFFVAMAQGSCTKTTDEALRRQVQSDVHAPARFQVNISLMNLPEFADAFDCPAGSPMAPRERCQLW